MVKSKTGQTLLVVTIMMIASSAFAQPRFSAGGRFTLGFPQNEFGDELDAIGFGGGGYFAYRIPESPVLIGADLNFLIYGSENRSEPWSNTIPDVNVDVSTTNSIFQGFLILRLQQPTGPFKPYMEGLFGFNALVTSTSVKSEWSNEDIASSTNHDDAALAYGFGGGIQFRIWDGANRDNPEEKLQGVFIDLGVRYIKGGDASYLKKGGIERYEEDGKGKIAYHPSQSTTDLLNFNIGVGFEF